MFFIVRSNDSFNVPLGWIKYIVIVTCITGDGLVNEKKNDKVWRRDGFFCFDLKEESEDKCLK